MSFSSVIKQMPEEYEQALAEITEEKRLFSLACKTYKPFQMAASYSGADVDAIVAERIAVKPYKAACVRYHEAQGKYHAFLRSAVAKKSLSVNNKEIEKMQELLASTSVEEQSYNLMMSNNPEIRAIKEAAEQYVEKTDRNKNRSGFFTERTAPDDTDRRISKKHKSPFSFSSEQDDPTLDLSEEL